VQSTIKLKGLPLGLPLIITRKRKKPETSRFLAFHQAGDERIEFQYSHLVLSDFP